MSVEDINAITGSVTSTDGTDTATTTATVFNEVDGTTGTDGNDIFKTFTGGSLDGGDGTDMLLVEDGSVDLSNVQNIEILKLDDTDGSDPLELSVTDVFNLTDGGNELLITGEGKVEIDSTWTKNETTSTPEQSVYEAVYNGSDIKLIIDQTVDTDLV